MRPVTTLAGLLLALLLTGCAAALPTPALPPLTTDAQRDQARACQATVAACVVPCNPGMVWNGVQVHQATLCVNTCKELLAACYTTLP